MHLLRCFQAQPILNDVSGIEKRKNPRAPIELKVEYKKMNTFFADYTKNISKSGTFIKTERPLPKGTEFVFKLSLPDRREPFVLRGKVVWSNDSKVTENPGESNLGMGIKFIFDEDSERLAFEGEVETMMIDSLGPHIYRKLLKKD